jgi:D-threo-aldose 1-dehydrogenase
MPEVFGSEVGYDQALQVVRQMFDSPVNFLDTANGYSGGASERRIGAVIAERGGLPEGFVLATKLGPGPDGSLSGARARESAQESLSRLGLRRLQLLYLHDPERWGFEAAMAPGGPVETLVRLQGEGITQHLGVAGGPVELMARFLRTGVFQVLLTHNRLTLLDRSAAALVAEAGAAGVGVVNAAVFGGGILAKGPDVVPRYAYRPATATALARARRAASLCSEFAVPLAAVALQYSARHPGVGSTVAGTADPAHVAELVRLVSLEVPGEIWPELERLALPPEEWLG